MKPAANVTNTARRRRLPLAAVAVSIACLLVFGAAGPAGAYFERVVASGRNVALGGAFTGVADDPTAILVNPAGLALMARAGALATYNQPFNVTGLGASFAAGAVPLGKNGVIGASWHYLGLRDALSENLLSLGYARHLISNSQDASLSIGATVDLLSASETAGGRSDNLFTGGLGVLLRPFPSIGMGYSIRNLVTGDIHLLDGGPGTSVQRQQSWGLAVKWHNRVSLALDRRQDAVGDWRDHAGVEIIAHPNLHLRAGMDGRYATGGFGVLWRGARADIGFASHADLGATYVFSIAWLPKVVSPYAQR